MDRLDDAPRRKALSDSGTVQAPAGEEIRYPKGVKDRANGVDA